MKLKAGIIGLGVGEAHIKGYQSHPECEVVALCDFSEEKIKTAKTKYPQLKITPQADEILEDPKINVISIASYDNFHYEQISKAIKNGKHVFVEKPLCLFENEARSIYLLLKENPRIKISSNLILRKSPRFMCLKSAIEKGEFGSIFYLDADYNYGKFSKITEGWRSKLDFYSAVYGGGIHLVDLLLWLTQDIVTEVSAYGTNISSQETPFRYNDTVVSILNFKSKLIGKVSTNLACVSPHFHQLSIYGTKATFVNSLGKGQLYLSRDPNELPKIISEAYPGIHKGGLIYDFIDSIIKDREPEVSQNDLFKVMSVCFAIEHSQQSSKSVPVSYIGENK